MELYWLEQTMSDVPAGTDWLSPGETLHLAALRFPRRRADWLLGRWTAKNAIARSMPDPPPFPRIEIRSAPSGMPELSIETRSAPFTISLSHRAGRACCAVAQGAVALGCDLEAIEPRAPAFLADYFTESEQTLVSRAPPADRDRLVTLLWSAKESALKALGVGLRADTRSVTVAEIEDDPLGAFCHSMWRSLRVRHDDQEFHGWWRAEGGIVRTLVAIPAPPAPKDSR